MPASGYGGEGVIPAPSDPKSIYLGIVIVNHGSVGSTARPGNVAVVLWQGTATPANALPTDLWYQG